jgi:hypothetical protein
MLTVEIPAPLVPEATLRTLVLHHGITVVSFPNNDTARRIKRTAV